LIQDVDWIVEVENDSEAAKYLISVYPLTEHEIKETVKKLLEDDKGKFIVAELDDEPAGCVSVGPSSGRSRHIGWLGIYVRRKHWGKGVGSALMEEAIKLAKQLGCRKLMLGTTEGNERAIRLYKKFGFEVEAYENEEAYVEGSWRKGYILGLELAQCEPKIDLSMLDSCSSTLEESSSQTQNAKINVRQLIDRDLDEVNRLQNCPESTKSTKRVPPITKEETKRWYEELKSREGRHCLASFEDDQLLGYLQFRAGHLPFPNLIFEEMIVDVNKKPSKVADALILAIKSFKERYGYRRIFSYIPETSASIISALKHHSFKNTGVMKNYYFIDGYYVNVALYGYP